MPDPVQEIVALTRSGQWSRASVRCSELRSRTPEDSRLWHIAAGIEKQLGRVQQAISFYRRAAELEPDSAGILFDYAMALRAAGNSEQAIVVLNRVVKCKPDNASAHTALGELYCRQSRHVEARQCFEQALRWQPDMVDALLGLSIVWSALERPDHAIACLQKAISIRPQAHELHFNLALLLEALGRVEDAYQACSRTLEVAPDYVPAIALQATIRRREGRYQEALHLLDPLIERGVNHPRVIEAFVSLCPRVGRCEEAVALSRAVCSSTGISGQDLMCLYFSTGHALDHLGRYDEAFDCFQKANQLRDVSRDVSGLQLLVENIIAVHDTDPVPKHTNRYVSTPKLIFIIGMPRSGTSLVEQILASHPDVYGAGELSAMEDVRSSIAGLVGTSVDYPHCMSELDDARIGLLRQAYLSRLPDASRGVPVLTDKQPGNFLSVGLIRTLFPDASIIHCTRDPLDTCLSCYFHNFQGLPFTYDLVSLGRTWRVYQRLMQHWQAISIPMMAVSYEALVDDVEEMTRTLLEYCGLAWDQACLRFHENERVVTTVSHDQVNQPIYKSSVARWKNYEAHLGPLIDALNPPDSG